ncbi:MAG TPA: SAM-dependent chlorinase/fluorinase [Acidimicrobiia bacterium]|nr:SAM-dependent chlorinase/fluorinase [Acidimicrobiia bacterium]
MTAPICFLSDFGLQDEFVGVVKGVLHRIAPESAVIDITHQIPAGDVRAGALALTRAIQYLPAGVVLAVVDPGVGTERRALAAATDHGVFIGPDNGLLSPAVAMVGGALSVHSIENPEARIPAPGATFHGRDIFAPAAGLLASGEATLEELGPELDPNTLVPMMLPLPKLDPPLIVGEAWWVDLFGNIETNVGPEEMELLGLRPGDEVEVRVGPTWHLGRWVTTYGEVEEGALAVHVDSAGLMALAVRGARADEDLLLTTGMAVTFRAPG